MTLFLSQNKLQLRLTVYPMVFMREKLENRGFWEFWTLLGFSQLLFWQLAFPFTSIFHHNNRKTSVYQTALFSCGDEVLLWVFFRTRSWKMSFAEHILSNFNPLYWKKVWERFSAWHCTGETMKIWTPNFSMLLIWHPVPQFTWFL